MKKKNIVHLSESRFKRLVLETAKKMTNNKRKRRLNESSGQTIYLLYAAPDVHFSKYNEDLLGIYSSFDNMIEAILSGFKLNDNEPFNRTEDEDYYDEYDYNRETLIKDLDERGYTHGFEPYGGCELRYETWELDEVSDFT